MRLHRYQNVCSKHREYCNIKRRNHFKKNDTFNYCLVNKMIVSDFSVKSSKMSKRKSKTHFTHKHNIDKRKIIKVKNITHQKLHSFCVIF